MVQKDQRTHHHHQGREIDWDSFGISLLLREEALTGVRAAADTAVKGDGEEVGDLCKDCMLSSSSIEELSSSSKSFSRTSR